MNTQPHVDCGRYVSYKDTTYVIVKVMVNDRVQLLNPNKGNTKLLVLRKNVTPVNHRPMTLVLFSGTHYLVSAKGTIISALTGRLMAWAPDHGNRVAIMELYNL